MKETLIATLGTEAQVVTTAYDLLAWKGFTVTRIVVVHTLGTESALARLADETKNMNQQNIRVKYEPVAITEGGQPLQDIASEQGAQATFETLFEVTKQAKIAGERVHISLAGGRKLMSVYAMLAAQLLFDPDDHLWYLLSGGDFLRERRMHPTEDDDVVLVPVPVFPAMSLPTTISGMGAASSSETALQLVAAHRQAHLRAFVREFLTVRERDVVRTMVTYPTERYPQWAARLHVSNSTLKTHVEKIYTKTKSYFGLERVTKASLPQILAGYVWNNQE